MSSKKNKYLKLLQQDFYGFVQNLGADDPSRVEKTQAALERIPKTEKEGRYNLASANLLGVNLAGVDFSNAKHASVNFYRANLGNANLNGAGLSHANLYQADLSGADLSNTDLHGADIRGATLTGTKLGGANLSNANLSRADLGSVNLSGANLSVADLQRTFLSGANLCNADLRESNLKGATLTDANLDGADLSGAIISFKGEVFAFPSPAVSSEAVAMLRTIERLKTSVPATPTWFDNQGRKIPADVLRLLNNPETVRAGMGWTEVTEFSRLYFSQQADIRQSHQISPDEFYALPEAWQQLILKKEPRLKRELEASQHAGVQGVSQPVVKEEQKDAMRQLTAALFYKAMSNQAKESGIETAEEEFITAAGENFREQFKDYRFSLRAAKGAIGEAIKASIRNEDEVIVGFNPPEAAYVDFIIEEKSLQDAVIETITVLQQEVRGRLAVQQLTRAFTSVPTFEESAS